MAPKPVPDNPRDPRIAGRIGTPTGGSLRSLEDLETLRQLVHNLREVVYISNARGEILDANRALLELLGVGSLDEVRRLSALQLFMDPEQRTRELDLLRAEGIVREYEFQIRRPDGHVRTVLDTCTAVTDPGTGETVFLGVLVDISDRKHTEDALRASLSLLNATLESTADGILVVDHENHITTYNRKFLEMWRIPAEVAADRDDTQVLRFVTDQVKDPEGFLAKVHALYTSPDAESYDEIEFKDGRVYERYSTPQRIDGRPVGRVWSFRDVTARKTAELRLVHDAFHDALTNLPNRSLFSDLLARALGRARRRDDYAFALLFLDIDRFKVVNDSLGHMTGDQLLVAIARRLERCVRPGDTVARLGGDEFTVLLDDITDVSDATRIADRIQRELNLPFNISGQEVFTSASIGIAVSASGYARPDDLLRDADIAMYRAKALGKARYEVFDADMHARAVTQLQLETDLRRALDREEFRVWYQPIWSLDRDALCGFEALVRWQHPQRGVLAPEEFMHTAEETGLIVLIGRVVLREACRQLAAWQREFPQAPPLTVSVNLSARQFRQPDLVDHVERALGAWELPPSSLRLEITESTIVDNPLTAAEMLVKLRALGVQIDLDDFGTGYSSLSYLHRFEMDAIKIDRSFVSAIGEHGENSEIVRTIVGLARSLNMGVVAEGVERPEQQAILRSLGCEKVQGYFYSPPITPDAVRALIKARSSGARGAPRISGPGQHQG
jgi:diguanylate cyclase (GGDEF)-like protein/PAS domain S-box-containing protein